MGEGCTTCGACNLQLLVWRQLSLKMQGPQRAVGPTRAQEFINFTLHYLADLDIPIKR